MFEYHSYGDHPLENMQYFPPQADQTQTTPVVFIHGGGWVGGSMDSTCAAHGFLIKNGYPIFNLDYPLAPESPYPLPLISVLKALAWIKEHYPAADRIHIIGDSAGGNLAAMAALILENPEHLDKYFENPEELSFPQIQSLTSIYGVLDRLSWVRNRFPTARLMMRCYAGENSMDDEVDPDMQITPVDVQWEKCPPFFIVAAEKDELRESSEIADQYFETLAKDLKYKCYKGEGHGFYEFPKDKNQRSELRHDILDFFESSSL